MGRIPFSGIHLARAKQVGEGVSPTLDAKVDVPRSAARIQECARVTSARHASYFCRQLLTKAAMRVLARRLVAVQLIDRSAAYGPR
jgi:hypothetical protein